MTLHPPASVRLAFFRSLLVAYDGPLSVRDPVYPFGPKKWTPEDGPQRAWLLSNLRSQVTDFLSDIE